MPSERLPCLEECRSNPVDKLTWPGYLSAVARKVREQNPEKVKIAKHLRIETAMTWGWIARQLCMGAAGSAANRIRSTGL